MRYLVLVLGDVVLVLRYLVLVLVLGDVVLVLRYLVLVLGDIVFITSLLVYEQQLCR